MCSTPTGDWLLYSDYGSDTVIKLCGRPDCTHSDKDCNAYFPSGVNICYYDGFLYTYEYDHDTNTRGVVRMNLDGSERLLVFDLGTFMEERGCRNLFGSEISNGIFSFGLVKLDDEGNQMATSYYYKLDGSMKEPAEASVPVALFRTDGDVFFGRIGYDAEGEQFIYGTWDPDTNTPAEKFRCSEEIGTGYLGSEAYYSIRDGILYAYTYETGSERALFDTGLRGNYDLSCFPDTLVVSDYSADYHLEDVTLHFYDWNFTDLGSVHIDFSLADGLVGVICGETPERFMLADALDCMPRYYIEKSDLGTGNIPVHAYILDFEQTPWK